MLKKIIPTSLCAAIVFSAFSVLTPANAHAGNFSITVNGPKGHVSISKSRSKPKYVKPKRHYVRGCTPGKAVHKAAHYGVRHAHVKRVGKRLIIVEGRKRHHHVDVAFIKKSRGCEVAWVDRTPIYRHYKRPHYKKSHHSFYGR